MVQEQQGKQAASWSDLPAGRRQRMAVLIGRMARRRLDTAPQVAEIAHEPFAGSGDSNAAEQDPRWPSRAPGHRLCPTVDPAATRAPSRVDPGPVRPR